MVSQTSAVNLKGLTITEEQASKFFRLHQATMPFSDIETCYVCKDKISGLALAATPQLCSQSQHFTCSDCITHRVHLAVHDRLTLFPANCCGLDQPWSTTALGLFLHTTDSDIDFSQYLRFQAESSIPAADRVYCANPCCAELLAGLQILGGKAICNLCNTHTCIGCKAHSGINHNCSTTPGSSWEFPYSPAFRCKKCPACGAMIELAAACNHMTCTSCDHQFCFICLVPYTTTHFSPNPRERGRRLAPCPLYNDPEYDADLYDARGLHRDTGLTREGVDGYGRNRSDLSRASSPETIGETFGIFDDWEPFVDAEERLNVSEYGDHENEEIISNSDEEPFDEHFYDEIHSDEEESGDEPNNEEDPNEPAAHAAQANDENIHPGLSGRAQARAIVDLLVPRLVPRRLPPDMVAATIDSAQRLGRERGASQQEVLTAVQQTILRLEATSQQRLARVTHQLAHAQVETQRELQLLTQVREGLDRQLRPRQDGADDIAPLPNGWAEYRGMRGG